MAKVLGILNLTPDSFSDGSEEILKPENSLAKAQALVDAGADFIDIGAESTRPGAEPLAAEVEWGRLQVFLEEFESSKVRELESVSSKLSLDSRNPRVVEKTFTNFGKNFCFLNDVSGLQNPELLRVIAETVEPGVKLIAMHSKGGIPPSIKAKDIPDDFYSEGLLEDMKRFWDKSISLCEDYGINHERIVLDPGLGFGKNLEQSLEIVDMIPELKKTFGLEILIGASRKSFLREWSPREDVDELTERYNNLVIKQGVDYIRSHMGKSAKILVWQ